MVGCPAAFAGFGSGIHRICLTTARGRTMLNGCRSSIPPRKIRAVFPIERNHSMVARDQHDSNVWAGRPVVMSGLFFCATAAILFGGLSDVVHAATANSNVAKSVQAHLEAGEFG